MPILMARFDIKLSSHVFLTGSLTQLNPFAQHPIPTRSTVQLGDFTVVLSLYRGLSSLRGGGFGSLYGGRRSEVAIGITNIQLAVSREETESIPSTEQQDEDMVDRKQSEYLQQRLNEYKAVAAEVVNNFVMYCKYELNMPLLNTIDKDGSTLSNPIWSNVDESEVYKMGEMYGEDQPTVDIYRFGVTGLDIGRLSDLEKAILQPVKPTLVQEILSDAQGAAFQGSLRRAVLEMAIACEIAVKQAYFAKSSVAGEAIDYLEDSGRIHLKVLELIDQVAKRAFGESFKATHSSDYQNIDYVFRCRNKIAHRGEIIFRDIAGTARQVDSQILQEWWTSVTILLNWIKSHQEK